MTNPRVWLIALDEYAGVTSSTGGVGRRYASLIPLLAQNGIDVTVALFSSQSLAGDIPVIPGVQFVVDDKTIRYPRPIRLLLRPLIVRRLFQRVRPDAVLVPEWQGLASMLPRGAHLITNLVTGMRLINLLTPQGGRPQSWGRLVANRIQIYLENRQIARSTGSIACSTAIEAWAADNLNRRQPGRVVRNCIDVKTVQAVAATAPLPAGWPETGVEQIVLFVGRLERRKGITTAIRAFNQLVEARADVRLVLAGGEGDSARELGMGGVLALASENAKSRITFLGDVQGPELYRAMHIADVVICPSLWEAFGNVALEVKAAGGCLVASSGSGFGDFCEDGLDSLLVEPGKPGQLALACSRLLDEPEFASRLRARGLERVQQFSAAAVAPDLITAIRGILEADRWQADLSSRRRAF